MKLLPALLCGFAFLGLTTAVFAAAPATNAPAAAAPPAKKVTGDKTPAATPSAPAAAPAKRGLKLDDYLKDLTTELKLSDSEKQEIEGYYVADGAPLQKILNDDALSPLQQAQQVADLRDARNTRIEALLDDLDRQQKFLEIEARYRVALTELAANGGLVAVAPAPAPTPAANPPASPPAPAAAPKT